MTNAVRILYVEDNDLVANVVKELFEYENWNVEICSNGDSAWAVIRGPAHFDVLITDQDLPDVKGLQLIERTRALNHRRHIPIIMFTAENCLTEAIEAGANSFLLKPDATQDIVPTVRRHLRRETSCN